MCWHKGQQPKLIFKWYFSMKWILKKLSCMCSPYTHLSSMKSPVVEASENRTLLQSLYRGFTFCTTIEVKTGSSNNITWLLEVKKKTKKTQVLPPMLLQFLSPQSVLWSAVQHRWASHLLGVIPRKVPNDGVLGNVWVGAVPGLQHHHLALHHLHLFAGHLHLLGVTWNNNKANRLNKCILNAP